MKTVTLIQIINSYDSPALTGIINYWKDYESDTVLMSYAELRRRNYEMDRSHLKKLKSFCEKNNKSDIDIYLKEFLSNKQCQSFEEYIGKANQNTKYAGGNTELENNTIEENINRYPTLKIIVGIIPIFAWIVGLLSVIIAISMASQGDLGLINSLPIVLSGAFAVLLLLVTSELIKVVVDIEYNTRKALGKIEK